MSNASMSCLESVILDVLSKVLRPMLNFHLCMHEVIRLTFPIAVELLVQSLKILKHHSAKAENASAHKSLNNASTIERHSLIMEVQISHVNL